MNRAAEEILAAAAVSRVPGRFGSERIPRTFVADVEIIGALRHVRADRGGGQVGRVAGSDEETGFVAEFQNYRDRPRPDCRWK